MNYGHSMLTMLVSSESVALEYVVAETLEISVAIFEELLCLSGSAPARNQNPSLANHLLSSPWIDRAVEVEKPVPEHANQC